MPLSRAWLLGLTFPLSTRTGTPPYPARGPELNPSRRRRLRGMEAKQGADPEVSELAADTEDPEVLELGAGPEDPELQLEPEPEPEPERRIVLVSKEGDEFEVEERLALLSPTITRMIEDGSRISLPSIRSKILTKLIEFARKSVDSQAAATHDLSWGEDFVCTIDPPCLTQLILVIGEILSEKEREIERSREGMDSSRMAARLREREAVDRELDRGGRRCAGMSERDRELVRDLRLNFAGMDRACRSGSRVRPGKPGRRITFRMEGGKLVKVSDVEIPAKGAARGSSSSAAAGSEDELCSAFSSTRF
ncbi:hypothetical protein HU200_045901 [Digitaria exilis]|uniref:SKP1 component POZ domain-containing protein n=1 Tax=Digitaria exilis TaxID=1010633 RepID=A0A835AZ08_9POAL|nr:hypothetical protein HU200_045901 [Digitaria exilis]